MAQGQTKQRKGDKASSSKRKNAPIKSIGKKATPKPSGKLRKVSADEQDGRHQHPSTAVMCVGHVCDCLQGKKVVGTKQIESKIAGLAGTAHDALKFVKTGTPQKQKQKKAKGKK